MSVEIKHETIIQSTDLNTTINEKNYKPPIAFVRVLSKHRRVEAFSIIEAPWKEGVILWENLALKFLSIDKFKECYAVEILDSTLEKQWLQFRS